MDSLNRHPAGSNPARKGKPSDNMPASPYTVCSAYSQADADSYDRCNVTQQFDTLAEAKRFARHALTDDYRRLIEAPDLLNYSKVMNRHEECVADYFRKGYVAPELGPDIPADIPAGNLADDDSARHLGDENEHANHS